MKRNYLLTHESKKGFEIWSTFKKLCKAHGWNYDAMRTLQQFSMEKRWPVIFEGYTITPCMVNKLSL